MRFKSFKIGKSDNEPEEDKVESDDNTINKVTGIEEKINKRTRNLEKTVQQLKGLSDASKEPEEDDDAPPKPHGPLSELTVEPGDDLMDIDTNEDISGLLDDTDEEITVVEVSAGIAAPPKPEAVVKNENETENKPEPEAEIEEVKIEEEKDETEPEEVKAEANTETETELKPADDGDSFNNLFSDEEEEVNPLANLISSLPDVTAQELLDDLKEIKEIMRERHLK